MRKQREMPKGKWALLCSIISFNLSCHVHFYQFRLFYRNMKNGTSENEAGRPPTWRFHPVIWRLVLRMIFWKYFEKFFCEKRNASTPLGIEPWTFWLPVECFIIWAKEVRHDRLKWFGKISKIVNDYLIVIFYLVFYCFFSEFNLFLQKL